MYKYKWYLALGSVEVCGECVKGEVEMKGIGGNWRERWKGERGRGGEWERGKEGGREGGREKACRRGGGVMTILILI